MARNHEPSNQYISGFIQKQAKNHGLPLGAGIVPSTAEWYDDVMKEADDKRPMDPFFEQVYAVVARIPPGRVMAYGQIARVLGFPRSARQVGRAMRHCPDGLPWQRVVMADGDITGGVYAPLRRAMLEQEGVYFLPDGRVDMARCRWRGEPEDADTK